MQGQQDYTNWNSFLERQILKRVTNEAGVVVTNLYGTVVNVHHMELNPHGNDPVEETEFMICFDSQANLEIIDVNTMSEYVMNYNLFPKVPQVIDVHPQVIDFTRNTNNGQP